MKGNIIEIFRIIAKEKSRGFVILFLIVIPIVLSILPIFYPIISLQDMSGNLISGLSLFVGLLFSLIITISDKVKTKKDEIRSKPMDDADKKLLNAYVKFGQDTVTVTTSVVLLGLVLIVLILISQICIDNPKFALFNFMWTIITEFLIIFLGSILLVLTYYILVSMYDFFFGQIGD